MRSNDEYKVLSENYSGMDMQNFTIISGFAT